MPTRRERRWLSEDAIDAKRLRRRLEREWRSSKSSETYIAYRKACRHANKAIINSRCKFYHDRLETTNTDPRQRWTVIRDVLHQTESPEVLSPIESQRLCVGFSDFFINKINNIKQTIKSSLTNKLCDTNPMQFDVLHTGKLLTDLRSPSIEEVSKLIRNMPAKSSVMDSIPTSVLKSSVDLFAPLIARLAALSFAEGSFPTRFKVASVTPLLKKKGLDRAVFANYRPISNLHTISKIIERITLSRITAHVESSPSYNRFQSAYRRGYSTETALTRLLNDVYLAADQKSRTLLLQLDLSAAFDTIDQGTLKSRLQINFGISGCALQWLCSYLSDRSQFVSVGDRRSRTTFCEFGVPQGSVLGPLLFSLYVSPIASVIASFGISHSQYADDTQLYISLKDEGALSSLSDCFKSVHWWFALNGLSLNPDKSEAIIIGTGARQRSEGPLDVIDLGDVQIQPSERVRSLGVIIDNTLSFNAHVDSVCKAANYHARALRHIRKRVTTDVALTVASTMVGARLDYRNAILYGTTKSNVQKLQRVQNSIARIVTGTRRTEHITPVLARLHWLKIAERIEYKVALLTFKALTTHRPDYLYDQLHVCAPVRQLRSTVSTNRLQLNRSRTVFADRAFRNAAPLVWKSLPH